MNKHPTAQCAIRCRPCNHDLHRSFLNPEGNLPSPSVCKSGSVPSLKSPPPFQASFAFTSSFCHPISGQSFVAFSRNSQPYGVHSLSSSRLSHHHRTETPHISGPRLRPGAKLADTGFPATSAKIYAKPLGTTRQAHRGNGCRALPRSRGDDAVRHKTPFPGTSSDERHARPTGHAMAHPAGFLGLKYGEEDPVHQKTFWPLGARAGPV